MEGLGAIVVVVAQSFTKVDDTFKKIISGQQMSSALKSIVESNRKEWNRIYVEFGNLVSRSIEVTSQGLSTANEFVVTLAPTLLDGKVPKERKKRQISNYIGDLDARTRGAQDMSQAFVNLEKNASRFVKDLKSALSGYSTPEMQKRIDQINNEITNLRNSISRLDNDIYHYKDKLKTAKVTIGATGAIGFIAPITWIGTAAASVKASKYSDQIDDFKRQKSSCEGDIASKERARNDLQADVKAIPPLTNALKKCSPDMQEIVKKIAACAKTWAQVRADTQDIKSKLEFVQKTEADKLFRDRVASTGRLCTNLRNGLESYQEYTGRNPEFKKAITPYEKATGKSVRPRASVSNSTPSRRPDSGPPPSYASLAGPSPRSNSNRTSTRARDYDISLVRTV